MILTNEIVDSYLRCAYKAYLLAHHATGTKTDFELATDGAAADTTARATQALIDRFGPSLCRLDHDLVSSDLSLNHSAILHPVFRNDNICWHFHAIAKLPLAHSRSTPNYAPVLFHHSSRITKHERQLLAIGALFLEELQGQYPDNGLIVYGPNALMRSIRLKHQRTAASSMRDEMCMMQRSPTLTLNSHCSICEFRDHCRSEAEKKDDISMISAMRPKDISAYRKKGIFSVEQLACTFRPRRRPNRIKPNSRRRNFALQALAIKTGKVYVDAPIHVNPITTHIYVDIEADLDNCMVYLLGIFVVSPVQEEYRAIWSNNRDEKSAFAEFVSLLQEYKDATVFHYGTIERRFFKRMLSKGSFPRQVESMLLNSVNILSLVHQYIYFPTYGNGLKEIARSLGYEWRNSEASGLQSVVWRRRWEKNPTQSLKDALIQYNYDDCLALRVVTDTLFDIANKNPSVVRGNLPIATVSDACFKSERFTWGVSEFALDDFRTINNCASFDHQRLPLRIRNDRVANSQRKPAKRPKRYRRNRPRPNRRVKTYARKCPQCENSRLSRRKTVSHTRSTLDLKVSRRGIKRWVTKYVASTHKCLECEHTFVPPALRKKPLFGDILKAWAVYQHVEHNIPVNTIRLMCSECFGLSVNYPDLYGFKADLARRHALIYASILRRLVEGQVVHADETHINLRNQKGYVWVFASPTDVLFMYRPDRQASFLQQLLEGFSGVLVSDFYAGYDGVACAQQKCLSHFLRDLNDDLLKHRFDQELRELAERFGQLLTRIIDTIDRRGLKKRYLTRHSEEVHKFAEATRTKRYASAVAQKYQKRIARYHNKMFTFLKYDDVPWNNANAEHAIKKFAQYRSRVDGKVTQSGIRDFLVLLTLQQTCKYRGVGFLQFLISGSRSSETAFESLVK